MPSKIFTYLSWLAEPETRTVYCRSFKALNAQIDFTKIWEISLRKIRKTLHTKKSAKASRDIRAAEEGPGWIEAKDRFYFLQFIKLRIQMTCTHVQRVFDDKCDKCFFYVFERSHFLKERKYIPTWTRQLTWTIPLCKNDSGSKKKQIFRQNRNCWRRS